MEISQTRVSEMFIKLESDEETYSAEKTPEMNLIWQE